MLQYRRCALQGPAYAYALNRMRLFLSAAGLYLVRIPEASSLDQLQKKMILSAAAAELGHALTDRILSACSGSKSSN